MNGKQQRTQRTMREELQTVTDAMVEEIDALGGKLAILRDETRVLVGKEHTARLEMAGQERDYVDRTTKPLDIEREAARAFRARGFWARINWIFTGR